MSGETPASEIIEQYIASLTDWRGEKMRVLSKAIREAVPGMVEEWKWETPVWSYNGNVVAAGVFKDHVKLNFFKGALLPDFNSMFNAGLDAKKTRGIDFSENDTVNVAGIKALVVAAAALNKK